MFESCVDDMGKEAPGLKPGRSALLAGCVEERVFDAYLAPRAC